MMLRISSLLIILLTLAACAAPGRPAVDDGAVSMQLFYGTDRNIGDTSDPGEYYGNQRGQMNYGAAMLITAENGKNARVSAVQPMSRAEFLSSLRSALATAERPSILVFAHGFNRSFDQASRHMTEFLHSTGFGGVPVLWSWPSSNNPVGYLEDETNMRWAEPDFARFFTDILEDSGAETVHLVGHSLGGRAVCEVLVDRLLPAGADLHRMGEFVLLAPDIDSEVFQRDYAPALLRAGLNVTLYTSANDKALASARALRRYPRAGDSSGGPLLISGMETIDVTSANHSVLGHSYFEKGGIIAQDLGELLNDQVRAADRKDLLRVDTPSGAYWQLRTDR